MSKLKVFCVYDSKVEAYMKPFFARTVGEALRSWEEICNDGQSAMAKHPHDFTLFECASWDEQTGKFEQLASLRSLSSAWEAKPAELRRLAEPLAEVRQ